MLFNSFEFFVLLAVTFTLYHLPLLRPVQLQILVAASLVFYAWDNASLLILLGVSISFNVWISYQLRDAAPLLMRGLLAVGLCVNLGIIVFFKYARLAVETFGVDDTGWGRQLAAIPLPIGISFYTFEAVSLLMDVARARREGAETFVDSKPLRHAGKTSLFIAFFPHLISGPILKARDFYPQIGAKRLADVDWWYCLRLIILGFFLKCVIADNLKDVTSELMFPRFLVYNSLTLVTLLYGYGVQIFADFAGYSLIAMGLGALFGYRLPENFNFPYIADSLSDFWRRWHISLSSWLRDYLYVPLGGNRRGRLRTYCNLLLVMFLGGLWHGAAWSYAVWGLYHGVGLAAERFLVETFPALGGMLPRALKMLLVFAFVTLGWLLFKLTDFREAALCFSLIFRNTAMDFSGQKILILSVAIFSLPVVVYHAAHLLRGARPMTAQWETFVYGAMLAACVIMPGLSGAFIYFQF